MRILENGTVIINDERLDQIADTYVTCSYLRETYNTFEKYLKAMVVALSKYS